MAENKTSTEKGANWGELGGNNAMHGFRGVGTQQSGVSSQEGSGSRRGMEPQAGGQVAYVSDNSKTGREMSAKAGSNKDYAGTATAGTSGPTKSGGDQKFAAGGNTSMFGNRGSQRAEPA